MSWFKDEEARQDIMSIKDDRRNFLVIDCPHCKHEVLGKRMKMVEKNNVISFGRYLSTPHYTCLTCGAELYKSTKWEEVSREGGM